MDDKRVLSRLVNVAMKTSKLSEMLSEHGYIDNPFFDLHGDVADTIYDLIGEHTDEFSESVTSLVLSSDNITDDQRVNILSYHYRKNHALA